MKPFKTGLALTTFSIGREQVAAALMVAALSLAPAMALAADRFAVISIANETNANVNIVYRWGTGEKKKHHFGPGAHHWFSYKYDHPDDSHSPDFFISFDADTTNQHYGEDKKLHGFRAPDQSYDLGHKYVFRYNGPSKRFIEIYDASKH
jgi:hypothetical protein